MAHASASQPARRQLCRCTVLEEPQPSSALSESRELVSAGPPFSEPFEWPARASASPLAHPQPHRCIEPAAPSGRMGLVSASPLVHPQPYRCIEPAAPPRSSAPSGLMELVSASRLAHPQPYRCTE